MIVKEIAPGDFLVLSPTSDGLFNLATKVASLIRRDHARLVTVDLTGMTINSSEATGLVDAKRTAREKGADLEIWFPDGMSDSVFRELGHAGFFRT